MIKEVFTGDNICIEIGENEFATAKVLDIRGDVLVVNRLKHPDSQKNISKSKRYNAYTTQEKRYLEFEVKYISDDILDNLQVSSVEIVSQIMIFQRRNNFRLSVILDFGMGVLDGDNIITDRIKGTAVDLSEFGALVCINTCIETGTRLICEFEINDHKIARQGTVLRGYQKENTEDKYFAAIEFSDENEKDLKEIRRFLFENERKQFIRTGKK